MQARTRNLIRCGLVTVVASAMAAIPGVGLANTRTHFDLSGDVQQIDRSSPEPVVTDASENETADIVRTEIAHTRKQVTERIKVRDLRRGGWLYFTKIKTSGRSYFATVGPGGHLSLSYQGGGGGKCPDRSATIDHEKHTVALRIPRTCLNNPRWVRFASYFAKSLPEYGAYMDQAFADGGAFDNHGYAAYTYSKRLRV